MKKTVSLVLVSALLYACVPARKYEDLKARSEQCQEDLAKSQAENEQFKTENNELTQQLAVKQEQVTELEEELADTKRKFLEKENNTTSSNLCMTIYC
jgi:hypothetical protein